MDLNQITARISELRSKTKKRNFVQTIDLIINLKEFDAKQDKMDQFMQIPSGFEKKLKICAFVDQEMVASARGVCDKVITKDELSEYKSDQKKVHKIAREFDIFIAQASLMKDTALIFGRILGPLGKMPNPKFGAVIMPKDNIKEIAERFRKSTRLLTKNEPILRCSVGRENSEDKNIAENIKAVADYAEAHLPKGKQNIKNILIKFTMSPPLEIYSSAKRTGEKRAESPSGKKSSAKKSGKKKQEKQIKEQQKTAEEKSEKKQGQTSAGKEKPEKKERQEEKTKKEQKKTGQKRTDNQTGKKAGEDTGKKKIQEIQKIHEESKEEPEEELI